MRYWSLIEQFCEYVNTHHPLPDCLDLGMLGLPDGSQERELRIADLIRAYRAAQQPTAFFNQRMTNDVIQLQQCYTLLHETFEPIELEPFAVYLEYMQESQQHSNPAPMIMIGRYWQTAGPQRYTHRGELAHFYYDPLTVATHLVAVVSGSYMSMMNTDYHRSSIGVMGHLVTREAFRGGQGHGSNLIQAFEQEVRQIAAARNERPVLILIEAQQSSLAFWYAQGFRYPAHIRYAQPPLEFDAQTGERLYEPVPETLMVKFLDEPAATSIDATLLKSAVQTMYTFWFIASIEAYPLAMQARARAYIDEVFADFEASLTREDKNIPLIVPPRM